LLCVYFFLSFDCKLEFFRLIKVIVPSDGVLGSIEVLKVGEEFWGGVSLKFSRERLKGWRGSLGRLVGDKEGRLGFGGRGGECLWFLE
jgi:hypothetical protein